MDDVDNRGVGFCPYLSLRSINDAWSLSHQRGQYGTLFSILVKILKGYLEGLNNGGWFVKSLAILQVADLAAGFQVTRKTCGLPSTHCASLASSATFPGGTVRKASNPSTYLPSQILKTDLDP